MASNEIIIEHEIGARPNTTEIEVVEILVSNGIPKSRVRFLKPSRVKGERAPDITIDDIPWEIKSIDRLGKYTLDHAERAGLRQADNLVFDLRRLTSTLGIKATKEIEREYRKRKNWKGLIVIVRYDGKCLTFNK